MTRDRVNWDKRGQTNKRSVTSEKGRERESERKKSVIVEIYFNQHRVVRVND